MSSSCFGLLLIAIDRYILIIYALRYESIVTPKRMAVAIAMSWTATVIFTLCPFFGWNAEYDTYTCCVDTMWPFSYIILLFLGVYLLPTCAILYLYGQIARVAMKQRRQIAALQISGTTVPSITMSTVAPPTETGAPKQTTETNVDDGAETSSKNGTTEQATSATTSVTPKTSRDWKTTKTLLIVVGYFIVSWLPYFLNRLLQEMGIKYVSPL